MSTSKRKKLCDDMAVLRMALVIEAIWERSMVRSVSVKDSIYYYRLGRLQAYRVALRMINYRRKLP
jgi:hypothetical protein